MGKYINKLTQAGFNAIQTELDELAEKREAAVAELTWARDLGDRSENAAYKSARRKLSSLDSRVRFLKRILENCTVVTATQSEFIDIGCRVVVHNGSREMSFTLVGDHEADPSAAKLSFKSPIGKALMGKKTGDTVVVVIPSGQVTYTIVSLSYTLT